MSDRFGPPLRLLALLLAGSLALASAATAQVRKLNGPLAPLTRLPAATDFAFSLDGARVLFRADVHAQNAFGLWSAPADGSAPAIELNDPLPAGGDVGGFVGFELLSPGDAFEVLPDDKVIFRADQTVDDQFELLVAPDDGSGAPVHLSPPGQNVLMNEFFTMQLTKRHAGLQVVPGGAHAFYQTAEGGAAYALRRIPLDGGSSIQLSTGQEVSGYWIRPDEGVVVFAAHLDPGIVIGREQVYAVPADGSSAPVLLDVTPPFDIGFTYLLDVRFTPDGTRALYTTADYEDDFTHYVLRSVLLDGSQAAVTLTEGDDLVPAYDFAPDVSGGRIAYLDGAQVQSVEADGSDVQLLSAALAAFGAPVVVGPDAVFATSTGLYRAPLDGTGGPVALTTGLAVSRFVLANPTTLVFHGGDGLFAVPVAGGSTVALDGPHGTTAIQLLASPDGQRVAFRLDRDTPGKTELYVVPVDGSQPPLKINPPLIASGDVTTTLFAPGGERLLYLADRTQDGQFELLSTPVSGGATAQFHGVTPTGGFVGDVLEFQATSDGDHVVYRADQDSDQVFDLFAVDGTGPGTPVNLTSLSSSGDVQPGAVLSPDGGTVVFSILEGGIHSLCSSSTLVGPPLVLDTSSFGFDELTVTPDGARVVYRKAVSSASYLLLHSAALDGLSAPVPLTPGLAGNRQVSDYRLAPDGLTVAYVADALADEVFELFRVPTDGSAAPLLLSPTPVAGGDVLEFQVTSDSQRVVFRGNLLSSANLELFSVPLDGSLAAVRLNATLIPNGDVTHFLTSPDASRAVYRADQTSDARYELFTVPVDGSASPLALITLTGTRRVEVDFRISAGGVVVFRANPTGLTARELFRAPQDASAPAVRLHGPLAPGGQVFRFALSPDGSRAAWSGDEAVNDLLQLHTALLSGGPAQLLDTLPSFANLTDLAVSPDDDLAVYRCDRTVDDRFELFSVRLDGGAPPRRRCGALAVGGNVQPGFLPLTGGRVLYLADEVVNDVDELFLGILPTRKVAPAPAAPGRIEEH